MDASTMSTRLGLSINNPDIGARAFDYINLGQKKLQDVSWWRHLEVYPPYQFATAAPYSAGTATPTNGIAAVSGIGTNWSTAAHAGQVLQFAGETAYYWIASVSNAASLTLQAPYIGSQSGPGAYQIYTVSYALPSNITMAGVKSVMMQDPHTPLDYIPENDLNEIRPNMLWSASRPARYFDIGQNIQFDPVPDAQYLMTLRYERLAREVSGSQIVLDWPLDIHECLLKFGIAEGFRDRGDAAMADSIEKEALSMALAIVDDNNGKPNARQRLKPFDYRGRTARVLRHGVRVTGGSVDV